MKRAHLTLAVIWGIVILATPWPGQPAFAQQEIKDLARNARGSVVLLEVLSGTGRVLSSGTGFFVGAETVVTNHHVIDSASFVQARFEDDTVLPVQQVLAENVDSDLAILRVTGATAGGLPLYRGGSVEPGEEVVVLGNPHGLSGTLSTGIVSAWRTDDFDARWKGGPLLQITAPISPGSSGSPVMNRVGEVLGVAVSGYLTGQNLNFAVPIDEVRRLIDRVGPEPVRSFGQSGGLQTPWVRNLTISLLVFGALIVFIRRL